MPSKKKQKLRLLKRKQNAKEKEHNMKNDFEALCRTLKAIHDFSIDSWDKILQGQCAVSDERLMQLYNILIKRSYPLTASERDEIIAKSKDMEFALTSPMYLPPLSDNKEFIPILHFECSMNKSKPEVNVRIGMVRYIEEEERTRGIGFRFECPHEGKKHTYYHVQLTPKPFRMCDRNRHKIFISSSGEEKEHPLNDMMDCPIWLPYEIPAIPIPSLNPVSLILCMWIGLYGTNAERLISSININNIYKKPLEYFIVG